MTTIASVELPMSLKGGRDISGRIEQVDAVQCLTSSP